MRQLGVNIRLETFAELGASYFLPIPQQSIRTHAKGIRQFVSAYHVFIQSNSLTFFHDPIRITLAHVFKGWIGWHHFLQPAGCGIQTFSYFVEMPGNIVEYAKMRRRDGLKFLFAQPCNTFMPALQI